MVACQRHADADANNHADAHGPAYDYRNVHFCPAFTGADAHAESAPRPFGVFVSPSKLGSQLLKLSKMGLHNGVLDVGALECRVGLLEGGNVFLAAIIDCDVERASRKTSN